jgi:hypothetical protein
MSFRKKIDPMLKEHFEKLIEDVAKEKNAYQESQKAQLWIGMAVLAKRISDIELKINKGKSTDLRKKTKSLKKELKKL